MGRFLIVLCFGITSAVLLAWPAGPAEAAGPASGAYIASITGHGASAAPLAQLKGDEKEDIDWDAIWDQVVEWLNMLLSYFIIYLDGMIDFVTDLTDTTTS